MYRVIAVMLITLIMPELARAQSMQAQGQSAVKTLSQLIAIGYEIKATVTAGIASVLLQKHSLSDVSGAAGLGATR